MLSIFIRLLPSPPSTVSTQHSSARSSTVYVFFSLPRQACPNLFTVLAFRHVKRCQYWTCGRHVLDGLPDYHLRDRQTRRSMVGSRNCCRYHLSSLYACANDWDIDHSLPHLRFHRPRYRLTQARTHCRPHSGTCR